MLKSNRAKFYKFDFFSIIYIFVTEHICDGFGTIITCVDSNQILQILNATFGMSDSQICPVSSQSKSHVQKPCRKDVTKRVQLQCKGRTFCIFRADAVIFGDPCPSGVRKYLEINYKCTPKGKKYFSFIFYDTIIGQDIPVSSIKSETFTQRLDHIA